jgi:hypothetical protein
MKNRKRESCTSGTVRDEDGNILIYSARPHDGDAAHTGAGVRKPPKEEAAGVGRGGASDAMGISSLAVCATLVEQVLRTRIERVGGRPRWVDPASSSNLSTSL